MPILTPTNSLPLDDHSSWTPDDVRLASGDILLFSVPSVECLYVISSFDNAEDDPIDPMLVAKDGESEEQLGKSKSNSGFFSFLSGGSNSQPEQQQPSVVYRKEPAQRQFSCDTLLYSNPSEICLDNFTDSATAYDCQLGSTAGESNNFTPATREPLGPECYPFASAWTREVVLHRNSPKESYGMSLRATRDGRVLVTAVDCESAADECGILPGDEVLSVNGFDVRGWPARNVAQCLVQGELACKLTVYHDPQLQKLLTWENFGYSSTGNTLQNESGVRQHKYMILRVDGPSHGQSTDDQTLGIVLRNGRVHSVTPDSPADAAGLVPGEVIVAVGTHDVVGYRDADIISRIQRIKGFFSITTMAEEDYRELLMKTMHISLAA